MKFKMILFLVLVMLPGVQKIRAQYPGHTHYPHLAIQQSWVDPNQSCLIPIFARYDLIIGDLSREQIQAVKAINPNAIILPFDSIIWDGHKEAPVPEWYDDKGRPDVGPNCPVYHGNEEASGVALDGLTFREWKARASIRWKSKGYDGVYLDHWDDPWWGNTSRCTVQQYKDGMSYIARRIRELWPGVVLIGNPGQSIDFGFDLNGFMWEDYPEFSGSLERELSFEELWKSKDTVPRMLIMNQRALHYVELPDPSEKKSGFWQRMRYTTGIGLLKNDIYVMYNYGKGGSPHWAVPWWFDEWSVDLGQPSGEMYHLSNGVLARKFDNGIVLVNATAHTQIVRREDLGGGTYYRFLGGQRPSFNTGTLFDQISLVGWSNNNNLEGDWMKPVGDAIILVKSPQKIVSDILLDDEGNVQNPILINIQGRFEQQGMTFNPDKYQYWPDSWRVHGHGSCYYADAGNGEAFGKWIPRIGIPGYYEILEWHPSADNFSSNAPYHIHGAQADTVILINQRKNGGRWNSLGVYFLGVGTSNYVQVSNKANGMVVADAVKFIYKGSSKKTDSIPPSPPKNVRVGQRN